MSEREPITARVTTERRLVSVAVGALGFSCVITQLTLLRELFGAFSGNELVLGVVLGNWLLLMGIGTCAGRIFGKSPKLPGHQDAAGDQDAQGDARQSPARRNCQPTRSDCSKRRARSDAPHPPLAGTAHFSVSGGFLLSAMLMLLAVLPLVQVFLLRSLRDVVFIRGAAVGVNGTVISAFLLLLPYCLVAGGALIFACSLLARHEGARGIGRVYVADTLGSIAGGILFSFVLVRFLDHLGILVWPAVLNLLCAGAISLCAGRGAAEPQARSAAGSAAVVPPTQALPKPPTSRFKRSAAGGTPALRRILAARGQFALLRGRGLAAAAGVTALALLAAAWLVDLDDISTRMRYPRQHIVARANSPYGRLLVTETDGQFNFIENGIPLTSTRDDRHVEETVHYAMAQRPNARRVLLIGGGISGTAKEILKYSVSGVDYVELDPLILELGRKFMPENLADDRIRTISTDGRLFIRQAGEPYDVVIVDVPAPSTIQLNRLFTVEFFAEVKRALSPDGVLSFPLGHYANYVSPELARMLSSAHRSLRRSFTNVLMIPGEQVFFLASDGPLSADIARRIEQRGVETKLVKRQYLEAMLAADRMADLTRAVAQPAALNEDFNPVLYYHHLRHWMSQFETGIGPVQVLLLVLLGVYLVRLRGAAPVLFASGFAGTALEIVLLLAFQVLCGSVYHQVGVIVTVFMAGLALGAWLAGLIRCGEAGMRERGCLSRSRSAPANGAESSPATAPATCCGWDTRAPEEPQNLAALHNTRTLLALLAAGIAVLAASLPFVLFWLNRPGGSGASVQAVKAIIALLTLVLATLAGMQFPLANRLEFDETLTGASRLYTADFMGAFLGALLASTWLIPLIGVTRVCLLVAALNVLGGMVMQFKKR
jgi:spermidine synthase